MYVDQIHLLFYSSLSLLFKAILMDFIILLSYIQIKYFDHIPPQDL
jgi:hypothetical protein